jgi:hypothetical protein
MNNLTPERYWYKIRGLDKFEELIVNTQEQIATLQKNLSKLRDYELEIVLVDMNNQRVQLPIFNKAEAMFEESNPQTGILTVSLQTDKTSL